MTEDIQHQIRWLMLTRAVHAIAFHILLPTLAIMFLQPPFQFSLSQAGLALTIYGFTDRGVAIFCAPIIDRIGPRWSLILGLWMGAAAITSIALFPYFSYVLVALCITGVGFSITALGARTYVGTIHDPKMRLRGFSTIYRGFNAGGAIGVILAFYLPFRESARTVILFAAAFTWIASIIAAYGLRSVVAATKTAPPSLRDYRKAFRGNGWHYLCLNILMFFLFNQIFELLPIYFEKTVGAPTFFGWVMATNCAMVVTMQGWITRRSENMIDRWRDSGLLLGFAALAIGSIACALVWNVHVSWLVVVTFSLAEMLVMPQVDYLVSLSATPALRPFLYGIMYTSGAMGRALCAGLGIKALDLALRYYFSVRWWWSGTGLLALGIVFYLLRHKRAMATATMTPVIAAETALVEEWS